MIVLEESSADKSMSKPVKCPQCRKGNLGFIPDWSEATISRRGKPPADIKSEGVQVKCPICKKLWTLTMK